MPRPLSATQLRSYPAGRYLVGGITGLYIQKSSRTNGFFYLRYSDNTGRHEVSLGLFPDLSLADARAAAAVARAKLARGEPFTVPRQQQRLEHQAAQEEARQRTTFETVARDWIRYQVQHERWARNTTGERVATRSLEVHHGFVGKQHSMPPTLVPHGPANLGKTPLGCPKIDPSPLFL